ncbi:hypothetical protein BLNAU_13467 [Blattamonas nauphoetae]|uniref:FAD-binding FR-type domain-containing protein n=1 Tax=Blattamonas nauphoetae TaxID=2049346 RepID=A0ABQ9XGK4_9EUKA|nr:hypothetical protein BLNAU_13467 [Blattamonas nauphoetae]
MTIRSSIQFDTPSFSVFSHEDQPDSQYLAKSSVNHPLSYKQTVLALILASIYPLVALILLIINSTFRWNYSNVDVGYKLVSSISVFIGHIAIYLYSIVLLFRTKNLRAEKIIGFQTLSKISKFSLRLFFVLVTIAASLPVFYLNGKTTVSERIGNIVFYFRGAPLLNIARYSFYVLGLSEIVIHLRRKPNIPNGIPWPVVRVAHIINHITFYVFGLALFWIPERKRPIKASSVFSCYSSIVLIDFMTCIVHISSIISTIIDTCVHKPWIVENPFSETDSHYSVSLVYTGRDLPRSFQRMTYCSVAEIKVGKLCVKSDPHYFTICSPPNSRTLQLLIKEQQGIFTSNLGTNLPDGQSVRILGPHPLRLPNLNQPGESLFIVDSHHASLVVGILRTAIYLYSQVKLRMRIRIIYCVDEPRYLVCAREIKEIVDILSSNEGIHSAGKDGHPTYGGRLLSLPTPSFRMKEVAPSDALLAFDPQSKNDPYLLVDKGRAKSKKQRTNGQMDELSCIRYSVLFSNAGSLDMMVSNAEMLDWIPTDGFDLLAEGDLDKTLLERMVSSPSKFHLYLCASDEYAQSIAPVIKSIFKIPIFRMHRLTLEI